MIPLKTEPFYGRVVYPIMYVLNWVKLVVLVGVAAVSVPAWSAGEQIAAPLPFAVGEVLEYDLKWSVFGVGRARMEVLPMDEFAGQPVWRFHFQVRTNAFADKLFKVRTRIDSWVSLDLSRTVHYEEVKREGKTQRDIVVRFDLAEGTAHYTNFGQSREPLRLGAGPVLDPLGAVYHLRSRLAAAPAGEAVCEFSVTDGKKLVPLRLQAQRRERIRVNGQRWDSLRFVPETGELGGVFEKSEDSDVRLWLTADGAATPLQVQGEVIVGSFWAKLRPE